MILGDIIHGTQAVILHGRADTTISGICSDSRRIKRGNLFLAVKGCDRDGHDFIEDAIANGAAAVASFRAKTSPSAPIISTVIPAAGSFLWE